jgi:probable phosphoglycerate mutase
VTDEPQARLVLIRHGETDWSASRRHTGRTDVPLNDEGRAQAAALRGRLPIDGSATVWCSPLSRARDTAELAGLPVDLLDPDLLEWDYGEVEGRTTEEMREDEPDWSVWDDAIADGESVELVGERVDRVIERALAVGGTVVLVAHAHLLRILTARWIELPPGAGQRFALDPASWSVLAHERETRVVQQWDLQP